MDIKEMNSWGLTKNILDIIENGFVYDEETGEVYFTEDDLKALEEQLDAKMNGICGYIKFAESKAAALKKRKEEIAATQKHFEKKAEKLNEYLRVLLEYNKITTEKVLPDYRIKFRASTSLKVTDEEKVKEYIKNNNIPNLIKVTEELSKNDLKKYLKDNGLTIDGAEEVKSNNHSIS